MSAPGHIPVLLNETLQVLSPQPGEVAVDCTVGRGGHALALANAVGPTGVVYGFDLDAANLAFAAERLKAAPARFVPVHDSFAAVEHRLASDNVRADLVLADLGVASTQLDDPARGLAFTHDGPLDMRLDPSSGGPTAADLLATLSERELADLIYQYGEDPFARRIARKLAEARRQLPITTTSQLALLVTEAYGPRARHSRVHPATRTFMALRIAVNGEHLALQSLLDAITRAAETNARAGSSWLAPNARIAIISFHSLEDRPVKHAFVNLVKAGWARAITKKPLVACDDETRANPRARSAKLRAIALVSSSSPS